MPVHVCGLQYSTKEPTAQHTNEGRNMGSADTVGEVRRGRIIFHEVDTSCAYRSVQYTSFDILIAPMCASSVIWNNL